MRGRIVENRVQAQAGKGRYKHWPVRLGCCATSRDRQSRETMQRQADKQKQQKTHTTYSIDHTVYTRTLMH